MQPQAGGEQLNTGRLMVGTTRPRSYGKQRKEINMNFNHDQLCKSVVRAVSQFADKPTREVLDQALYILAELFKED